MFAKSKRFLEPKDVAPSPADYYVKLEDHVPGTGLSKSARFLSSPTNSEVGSVSSFMSTPSQSSSTRKLKLGMTNGSDKRPSQLFASPTAKEVLNEKIVECQNKDLFIKELTEQIEELKQKITFLTAEHTEYKTHIKQLQVEHNVLVKNLISKNDSDKFALKNNICKLEMCLAAIKDEHMRFRKENGREMQDFLNNLDNLRDLLQKLTYIYNEAISHKNKQINNLDSELKKLADSFKSLETAHANEISDMKTQNDLNVKGIEHVMFHKLTELLDSKNDLRAANTELKATQLKLAEAENQNHAATELFENMSTANKQLESKLEAAQKTVNDAINNALLRVQSAEEHLIVVEKQIEMPNINYLHEIARLEKEVEELKSLIEPFQNQLMLYEAKNKALESVKNEAEREAREIGLKYAKIMGNQNHKQKIKYVKDLKEENHKLLQKNHNLELKVQSQAFMISQLQDVNNLKSVHK